MLVVSLCILLVVMCLFPFPLSTSSLPKVLGTLGMSVVWMSGRVDSSPEVIGSVAPQTVYVGDSLSIPLDLSDLFTDYFTLRLENCSLAFCELQRRGDSLNTVITPEAFGVAVEGNYAYVATTLGLRIVDISDPLSFSVVGGSNFGPLEGIAVQGNYTFLATANGLLIVDVSHPSNPVIASSAIASEIARGVAVQENYAYVATATVLQASLQIVNISDPLSPSLVSNLTTGESWGVAVGGHYAFVATRYFGSRVVNITDPFSPSIVRTLSTGNSRGVAVQGDFVYVAASDIGLRIVNISHPSSASTLPTGDSRGVAVQGNYAYVASFDNGLQVLNISDPLSPALIRTVDIGPSRGVVVEGNYIYVATVDGLVIFSHRNVLVVSPDISDRNNYTIRLSGCNSLGNCSDPLEIHVNVPNREPTYFFAGGDPMTFHVGSSFNYPIYFIDLDRDLLSFSFSSLPIGWSFSSNVTDQNERTNIFIIETLRSGAQGNWTIEVNGNDGYGGSAALSFQVIVPNRSPRVNERPPSSVTIAYEKPFENYFSANLFVDEDGDPLEYSAMLSDGSSLPSTLQFEGETLTLQGTLSQSVVIRFEAKDPFGDGAFFETEFQVVGTPSSSGFPVWGIVLIVVLPASVLLIGGLVGLFVWRRKSEDNLVLPTVMVSKWTRNRNQVGNRYSIMTHIRKEEVSAIFQHAGVRVTVPEGEESVKFRLGEGNFGVIKLAFDEKNGQFVACKVVKGEEKVKTSLEEAQIQRDASQPPNDPSSYRQNVLPIFNTCQLVKDRTPVIYHFMPLCALGNGTQVISLMKNLSKKDTEDWMFHVSRSVLTGVMNIHSSGIIHSDLKPDNLVFQTDGTVYITDFGCAQRVSEGKLTQICGDSRYFAPEKVDYCRSEERTKKEISGPLTDAFAVGLTLLDFMGIPNPFTESVGLPKRIQLWDMKRYERAFESVEELKEPAVGSVWEVIQQLLQVNPEDRISLREALNMQYFKRNALSKEQVQHIASQLVSPSTSSPSISGPSEYANAPQEMYYARVNSL